MTVQPFSVLPHPVTGTPLVVATEALQARAAAEGVETVSAWNYPHLIPLLDAARLTDAIARANEQNGLANDARNTFREMAAVKRALAALGRQSAEKRAEAENITAYNATLPARKAAAVAAAKASGASSTRNLDDDLEMPDFASFEAFVDKAAS